MASFLELHSLKSFELNQVHSDINIFGHSSQIIALVKIVDVFGVDIFRGKQQMKPRSRTNPMVWWIMRIAKRVQLTSF